MKLHHGMNGDGDLAALARALSECKARGRGRVSPVYRWMEERREGIAALIAVHGASWEVVALQLAGQDIRDGDGKVPTPSVCRKTWSKVQARAKRAAKAGA